MIWWVLAGVLLVLAFFSGLVRGRVALGPGRRARALPEKPPASPLAERMGRLDAAIDDVREATDLLTAVAARAAAATALSRSASAPPAGVVSYGAPEGGTGPGTAAFEQLLARIAEIDDDDRRELADAGLDPNKIVAALASPTSPERWRRDLASTLDYFQQGLRHLPTRRYG